MIQLNIKNSDCTLYYEEKLPYLFLTNKFNEELVLISKLEMLNSTKKLDSSVTQICNVDYFVKKKLQNKDKNN